MSLSRPFDDPFKPPNDRPIVTLKDAAAYILKLPKSAQHSPECTLAALQVSQRRTTPLLPVAMLIVED